MIIFPNISPEIVSFSVGGFEVALRWYAVSYIAGFIVAALIMRFFIRRAKLWRYDLAPMEVEQVDTLITYLIIGVILGGRLGYVLFYNLSFYFQHPIDILKVWEGGMSFHGGFLGVVVALLWYFKFNGINVNSGSDLIALATPPGLLFGRIANFINAELWGNNYGALGCSISWERRSKLPHCNRVVRATPVPTLRGRAGGFITFFYIDYHCINGCS